MMSSLESFNLTKKIGILAHSYEGGTLCLLTACREGSERLGPHMHPTIILSAIPMGLSMPAWEADNYQDIEPFMMEGVKQLASAGADFFICPDNTAHIVLENMIGRMPIPGLHIAEVVCHEIQMKGWKKVGLLGTTWTMTGPVYSNALSSRNLEKIIPGQEVREEINRAIFEEFCQSTFLPGTIDYYVQAIEDLKSKGAECVILGCTEIPLIITEENSSLPIIDTTRLLAKYAVRLSLSTDKLSDSGWLNPSFALYIFAQ